MTSPLGVLATCPPILGMIEEFRPRFAERGVKVVPSQAVQTLGQDEFCATLPQFDGGIIGDDPTTRRMFSAGKAGRLKAAVKWARRWGAPIAWTSTTLSAGRWRRRCRRIFSTPHRANCTVQRSQRLPS